MPQKNSLNYFKEAKKELGSGNLNPVYVLCGEEKFFSDRLVEQIESLVPESQKDFNFDLIYGREATVERVLEIARSYPMMAKKRVVIVRDFMILDEKVSKPGEDSEQGGGLEKLIPYLDQPNPSTFLVLTDTKTPNGRTKLGKKLKKGRNVSYYEFKKVPDYKIPEWIEQWVSYKYGQKMAPGVAEKIAQSVGNSLLVLATEIDKVCTLTSNRDIIESEAVQNVIGTYKEYSVFDLKSAVVAHNVDEALAIADQMLLISGNATGEVFKTIGYFYSMFSNLLKIRRLAMSKLSKNQIQKELGIGNTWYFNQLWKEANAFGLVHIHLAFETLLDADRAMKGFSKMDQRGIFLMMIERLTRVPEIPA